MVYPVLGSVCDLRVIRLSGAGLGNAFYNYFHAVRAAEEIGATVIAPPWASLKPGTIIRRERSNRFYGGLLKPHFSELAGLSKLVNLARGQATAVESIVDPNEKARIVPGRLNLTKTARFEFGLLHEHRSGVRQRLLSISRKPITPNWGRGGFIALHVRLGDFAVATRAELELGTRPNLRIPLAWYAAVLRRLRITHPNLPAVAFSDGSDAELAPLLKEGVRLANNPSDLDDLLSLASATILVGANSTFSQWAAFLGDMPTVWFKSARHGEKPTGQHVSIAYLDFDAAGPLDLSVHR
jgi:hypothetical protein